MSRTFGFGPHVLVRPLVALIVVLIIAGAMRGTAAPAHADAAAAPIQGTPMAKACIPVKGQRQLPDLTISGTPDGNFAIIENVGCGSVVGPFSAESTVCGDQFCAIEPLSFSGPLAPGKSFTLNLGWFDCELTEATLILDQGNQLIESNEGNNAATFHNPNC